MSESKIKKEALAIVSPIELTDRERFFLLMWLEQAITANDIEDKRRYNETYSFLHLDEIEEEIRILGGKNVPYIEKKFTHSDIFSNPGTGTEFPITKATADYLHKVFNMKEATPGSPGVPPMPGVFIRHLLPVQERIALYVTGSYKAPSTKTQTGEA